MSNKFRFKNSEVTQILKEALAVLEVTDASRFRIRAYQDAISSIDNLTTSVYDLYQGDRLSQIPGVGGGLAQHLIELFKTGKVKEFESRAEGLPKGMFALLGLRGIGSKKAFKLAQKLNLNNRKTALKKLEIAAKNKKIQSLDGFGEKSEKDILTVVKEKKTHKKEKPRMLLNFSENVSLRIVSFLKLHKHVKKVEVLGSFRRREATVGDLDIAVATNSPETTIDHFLTFSEIGEVLKKGTRAVSVVLNNDAQVDLRLIDSNLWGSMLQYFTGSKQHNILLRTYALDKGLSLSEYGIKSHGKVEKFKTEKEFYKRLGLDYIAPELRQGKDEIMHAKYKSLPDLVKKSDLKGDLHTHTTFSDGINTIKEMAIAAKDLGYSYFGISDHAPSLSKRGEKEIMSIIDTQSRVTEQLNDSLLGIRLLLGYEVVIKADAKMALPDNILKRLDFVIGSIHTAFNQSQDQITKRLLTAIKNPHVKIIGHPTGRLLNERPSIDANWDVVLDAVKKYDKILEINSQPQRLDLPEDLVFEAVKRGVKIIISSDAHSVESLNLLKYGIDVARRGWCEKKNIVNTLPLSKFLRELDKIGS